MVIVVSSVYLLYLVILFIFYILSYIYNLYDSYLRYYELIMVSDYEYNCIWNINVFVMARYIIPNWKKEI